MKKFLGTLVLCLLLGTESFSQTLTASVNRKTIPEGETLMLSLEYDGDAVNASPDLSVLEKDFTIYSAANSFGMQMINGKTTQLRQWNLVLMPNTIGKLTIPAISLGSVSSNPVDINVVKAGTTAGGNLDKQSGQPDTPRYSLRGRINNNTPYVQQEIIYKLSLYDSGGLQGGEPVFENVSSKDWVIRSLGDPEVRPISINGKNMREIVFSYAMFPQKSGMLTIPSARFDGYYLTKNSGRRDPFQDLFGEDIFSAGFGMADMFASRTPVVLRSKPIQVDVKAIPQNNDGKWWLPAQNLMLYGTWEPSNPTFKTGEAVSRTIYLKADGVLDSQLPDLKFPQVKGLKQYPEKPQTQMTVENGSVISAAKIVNVYIPNKPGVMTLPAVEVDWFNVKTGQYDKAVLPEATINVEGADLSAPQEDELKDIGTQLQADKTIAEVQNSMPDTTVRQENYKTGEIVLLLLGAFGFGIVISYLVLRKNKPDDGSSREEIRDYHKYIKSKAQNKDLRALRDAIIEWSRNKYQSPATSFNDVSRLVNDKVFSDELDKITAALYSDGSKEWDANAFLAAFEKAYKKKPSQKKEDKLLPDLYK